jgi:hypothetical protein
VEFKGSQFIVNVLARSNVDIWKRPRILLPLWTLWSLTRGISLTLVADSFSKAGLYRRCQAMPTAPEGYNSQLQGDDGAAPLT